MARKARKRTKLSAASQQIVDLVDSLAAGNQRKFAAMVGCSQPAISRVINGLQKPGRGLVERIAKLEGVDGKALLQSYKDQSSDESTEEALIPIARCLLQSSPDGQADRLTANTVAVSASLFRPTLYAVQARACEPAFSDPSEKFRPDDLIVIDSAIDRFRGNLMELNGRLCAVIVRDRSGETITLRRVWVQFDPQGERRFICTCSDAKVNEYWDKKYSGKEYRAIQLDPPEQLPESELASQFMNQEIDVSAITGMAIQLIRSL